MSSLHRKLLRRTHQQKMSVPSSSFIVKHFLMFIEEHNIRFRSGTLTTAIESIKTCGNWSDVAVTAIADAITYDMRTEDHFVPIIHGFIQSIRAIIPSFSDLRGAIDSYWMMLSPSIETDQQIEPNSLESLAISGGIPSPLENSVSPVSSVSSVSLDSHRHTPEGREDNDEEIVNPDAPPNTPIPSNSPRRNVGDCQSESEPK